MSNIKPNPVFIPTPGVPTAAAARFPYHHPTLAEMQHKADDQRRRREAAKQYDRTRYELERRSIAG